MNLQTEIFSNTVQGYLFAIGIWALLLAAFRLFHYVVLWRLHKLAQHTSTDLDDTFISILKSLTWPFYIYVAFYVATITSLDVSGVAKSIIDSILILFVVKRVTSVMDILSNYVVKKYMAGEDDPARESVGRLITKILNAVIWVLGVLFLLSNIGINVTSFIATLGIGGVAVALALQNILGDLFSSLAIYLDRPFTVGDFIVVGDKMGTVEHIGVKTTRLRALQGEELILSNRELTSAQIQNYKQMEERRAVFSFGLVYDTPVDKLRAIPEMVENIITKQELARFDRAHFHKFDDSALAFEVVYYVQTSDYNKYMDIHQNIHLSIKEEFAREGIEMAYPTSVVYAHIPEKAKSKSKTRSSTKD